MSKKGTCPKCKRKFKLTKSEYNYDKYQGTYPNGTYCKDCSDKLMNYGGANIYG